jgi:hypothetical protein
MPFIQSLAAISVQTFFGRSNACTQLKPQGGVVVLSWFWQDWRPTAAKKFKLD